MVGHPPADWGSDEYEDPVPSHRPHNNRGSRTSAQYYNQTQATSPQYLDMYQDPTSQHRTSATPTPPIPAPPAGPAPEAPEYVAMYQDPLEQGNSPDIGNITIRKLV